MISTQSAVYLLVPDESNERVLHPGKVLAVEPGNVVQIGFEQRIAPPAGSDVNLFFDYNGKFLQQNGTITAANESTNFPPVTQSITFQSVGSPVSADSRGSYRVSVVDLQVTARIDKERNCPLVDVSPEGLGVITKQNYRLGTAVKILFDYEDQHLEGLARVQTVRQLPAGGHRCGLLVPSTEDLMRRSLRKITALVQRAQLRNLRKSA
ncbi:MAG: PilZ domain-containing protein [Anaerolineae bacterium]|nr:PilZ domain-containing protein [Phycisphaerae bacterium]